VNKFIASVAGASSTVWLVGVSWKLKVLVHFMLLLIWLKEVTVSKHRTKDCFNWWDKLKQDKKNCDLQRVYRFEWETRGWLA